MRKQWTHSVDLLRASVGRTRLSVLASPAGASSKAGSRRSRPVLEAVPVGLEPHLRWLA